MPDSAHEERPNRSLHELPNRGESEEGLPELSEQKRHSAGVGGESIDAIEKNNPGTEHSQDQVQGIEQTKRNPEPIGANSGRENAAGPEHYIRAVIVREPGEADTKCQSEPAFSIGIPEAQLLVRAAAHELAVGFPSPKPTKRLDHIEQLFHGEFGAGNDRERRQEPLDHERDQSGLFGADKADDIRNQKLHPALKY